MKKNPSPRDLPMYCTELAAELGKLCEYVREYDDLHLIWEAAKSLNKAASDALGDIAAMCAQKGDGHVEKV